MSKIEIFVFGSNLAGRHGKGAAKDAVQYYGAQYGNGVGIQGHAYAIPTKDHYLNTLPLDAIKPYVQEFIAYAYQHPEYIFKVTRVGCGLAGYDDLEMALLFKEAPNNCELSKEWLEILNSDAYVHP